MKEKNLKRLWAWIWAAVVAIILALFIRFYLFVPIIVDGVSMMPTLIDGNRVIINRFGSIERFDVVVFREGGTDYIKRVIGLPGDVVEYKQDTLYINGKKYDEPYLDDYKKKMKDGYLTEDYSTKELLPDGKVPSNAYFVLGDNRRASRDSRIIGPVSKNKMVGTAPVCYWPLADAKIIN
ncbi:type I signal peptidase SipZ [Listeria fleischmannii]|uniref:Signal peptidase I n=1 Tax=Listeria fleischmannii TaxID=1069827 RepID=A0A841YAX9_9LIST|nr:type I signal peptidase SipZ [Listeria fleischmannii]EIA20814.1 signal peptidase I [Listeria fleischmannii subsp. coloradonensis]MBC1397420.1 type I signal peptidase SipZ [Listeria fleischmannii]MBC1418443.1 type I signal peptidase SipZ [Listeria fleischmannii]MBC1425789.1 type I signal peptidase SipZ [Listeria fleischmannii]STY35201.1 Signal peptidase I S [Listeria fleischmannii subsp. coloradonensis]